MSCPSGPTGEKGEPGRPRTVLVLNLATDRLPVGAVYGGRPGSLGNPYQIGPDGDRDEVCRLYEIYFHARLRREPTFASYVSSLRQVPALYCHCRPLRCHLETVARYLESLP